MINQKKQIVPLVLSLLFVFFMMNYTFDNKVIFWYLYAFTILVGIAISLVLSNFKDDLETWRYLLFGIGYGTILYGIVKFGNFLMPLIYSKHDKELAKFLQTFEPQNIWHILLLVFVIVIGEEMFWRGYVQQKLKLWVKPFYAVLITSILFALSLELSGFMAGAIAAFIAGLILGLLYEWKKSLPLIIIAHETFVILLFIVLPL